jgi:hypothetical protein
MFRPGPCIRQRWGRWAAGIDRRRVRFDPGRPLSGQPALSFRWTLGTSLGPARVAPQRSAAGLKAVVTCSGVDRISACYDAGPMSKQHFFVRLIPSRATFPMDMTAEEKLLMQEHVRYTQKKFAAGKVLLYGPVMAPAGAFGMAVFEVADEARYGGFCRITQPCEVG